MTSSNYNYVNSLLYQDSITLPVQSFSACGIKAIKSHLMLDKRLMDADNDEPRFLVSTPCRVRQARFSKHVNTWRKIRESSASLTCAPTSPARSFDPVRISLASIRARASNESRDLKAPCKQVQIRGFWPRDSDAEFIGAASGLSAAKETEGEKREGRRGARITRARLRGLLWRHRLSIARMKAREREREREREKERERRKKEPESSERRAAPYRSVLRSVSRWSGLLVEQRSSNLAQSSIYGSRSLSHSESSRLALGLATGRNLARPSFIGRSRDQLARRGGGGGGEGEGRGRRRGRPR